MFLMLIISYNYTLLRVNSKQLVCNKYHLMPCIILNFVVKF